MAIIILEGIDGIGKSTIAQRLVELDGGRSLHFPHIAKNRLFEWLSQMQQALVDFPDMNVVVDRLHLSELAYGPLVRGEEGLTQFEIWVLEGWLRAHDAYLFLLDGHNQHTLDRFQERYRGVVDWRGVSQFLRYGFEFSHLTKTLVRSADLNVMVDRIRNFITYEPVTITDDGMGTVMPEVWFVGEQHNLKDKNFLPNTTLSGGCGKHLFKAFKVAGFNWDRVHVSNAYDDDGVPYPLYDKWAALGYPKVVALGGKAMAALAAYDVRSAGVWHPQYMRRFHANDVLGYAENLRKAVEICG
ncbi:hypothetical protein LCGC14_0265060 [marine sediment metagenome]|uniref:Uncharacterized protein n=1 Tax=marine sediment metagenome TaxID=412755 RepID=A0A0F9X5U6_9ZZZZ